MLRLLSDTQRSLPQSRSTFTHSRPRSLSHRLPQFDRSIPFSQSRHHHSRKRCRDQLDRSARPCILLGGRRRLSQS
ncbi:hypothetical protein BDV93DRAFT_317115 [Ceratobasidium sp. AG-I]|nr:hypothetical protein BDV93DRAFT_317115 [Ceratobasidium sp. AG-I]